MKHSNWLGNNRKSSGIVESLLLLTIAFTATAIAIPNASAQTCIETASCSMTPNPFDWLLQPLTMTFGDLTYIMVWGLIITPIYIRSKHPLLVAVVGVFIMLGLTSTTTVNQSFGNAIFYGFLLMIPAIALVGFSVFRRANQQ